MKVVNLFSHKIFIFVILASVIAYHGTCSLSVTQPHLLVNIKSWKLAASASWQSKPTFKLNHQTSDPTNQVKNLMSFKSDLDLLNMIYLRSKILKCDVKPHGLLSCLLASKAYLKVS